MVAFQAITGIQPQQIAYIGSLTQQARDALIDPDISVADIRRVTLLTQAQALELQEKLTVARATVAQRAELDAISKIVCVWESEEQVVWCGEGALTVAPEGFEDSVSNPSIIAAGTVTSDVSQAAANAEALGLAQLASRCLWGNREVTVSCHGDLGFAEEVPVDGELVGEAPRVRVGSVTIAAASIFSDVSQDDADELARQTGLSALDCFYINSEQIHTCPPDPQAVAADLRPAVANYGNPVTIPAGQIVSNVSTEEANILAADLAAAFLECAWSNTQQIATCPEVAVESGVIVAASENSPVLEFRVLAGEVQSPSSQAEANEEALTRALLSLDCLYCNPVIPPLCYPSTYTPSVLPIPLSEITDAWSLNATRGLPAGTFCSDDAVEIYTLAHSVGDAPAVRDTSDPACPYGNAEIRVSCVGATSEYVIARPPATLDERGGPCKYGAEGSSANGYILPAETPIDDTVYLARFDATQGAYLSSLSTPNPFAQDPQAREIVIAENFLTVTEAQVPGNYLPGVVDRARRYATELAATLALSSINCFFANCAGLYHCHGRINENDYAPPHLGLTDNGMAIYGDGTMIPRDGDSPVAVHDESIGSLVNPLIVTEGQFTSHTSRAEVEAALQGYLLSALNCFWANAELNVYCGSTLTYISGQVLMNFGVGMIGSDVVHPESSGSPDNPVIVPENFFRTDVSPEFAQLQAFQMGLSQLNCFFRNTEQTAVCEDKGDFSPDATTSATVQAELYESRSSQAVADLLAQLQAQSQLDCRYDSKRVFIEGSAGGGGEGAGSPCEEGETRTGPDALAAGAVQSTISTAAATALAKSQLQAMQSCSDSPEGGAPGNDGAQTGCEGPCFGFFS